MSPFAVLAAFLVALLLTGAARWYALRFKLLDLPNERSMHTRPTPRGGGIAIVIPFLAGTTWLAYTGLVSSNLAIALIPPGALVAAMGSFDDRHTLSNKIRMALWFPAAIWAVYWLGGLPTLDLGTFTIRLGIAGFAVAVIGVVWVLNLYNFMDGTDGLAGTQTVMAAGVAGLLLWKVDTGTAWLAGLLAASSAGFLVWNWPPAKIFMGDVGSGFLGFTFAVLAIHTENAGTMPLGIWGILLAVFLVDATLTVARRMQHKEPWSQPHRSHAYQVQARKHSHRAVAIGLTVIATALSMLAWVVVRYPLAMLPALAVVVLGLALLWRIWSNDPEVVA